MKRKRHVWSSMKHKENILYYTFQKAKRNWNDISISTTLLSMSIFWHNLWEWDFFQMLFEERYKERKWQFWDKSKHQMWAPTPLYQIWYHFVAIFSLIIHSTLLWIWFVFQYVGIRKWNSSWKRIWRRSSYLDQTWC
jgi:hypothetical protein